MQHFVVNVELTQQQLTSLKLSIRTWSGKQLTQEELAAQAGYTMQQFRLILHAYPEIAEQIELYRIQGLVSLKNALWEKACSDKNWDAMKFLLQQYLGMGDDKTTPVSVQLSEDQITAMRAILDKGKRKAN